MKPMIGIRIDPELRKLLDKLAAQENRTLSSFVVNAVLTYIKEHHGITFLPQK